ncbi:MAG: glycoside hydrolase family 19 protein [Burkholderiales bacterium]|nr:glycoside hydrolase family 19 protein [Burkholderiales bacterium]
MDRLTIEQLCYRLPQANAVAWAGALAVAADEFGIREPRAQAMWLANLCHESAGLTRLTEDMCYTAKRLAQVWPARYAVDPRAIDRRPNALAHELAGRPDAIACDVYAGRMGNGPAEWGDGWRYRGRYPLMLTGRANYSRAHIALGIPDMDDPDALLGDIPGMARLCGWYWQAHYLDTYAEADDFPGLCRAWNGGDIGIAERHTWHRRAREALGMVA